MPTATVPFEIGTLGDRHDFLTLFLCSSEPGQARLDMLLVPRCLPDVGGLVVVSSVGL